MTESQFVQNTWSFKVYLTRNLLPHLEDLSK